MFLKGQKSVNISIAVMCLIVVSGDMQVIGIVSEKDMLKLLYSEEIGDRPVSDIMTKDIKTFDEDDDLFDIYECLMENSSEEYRFYQRVN